VDNLWPEHDPHRPSIHLIRLSTFSDEFSNPTSR
jgi:hypothetical protein